MPRRILTDATGYGLLLLALLTGWLPGPGGIPLALLGLSLLSIHNPWAHRIRVVLIARSAGITGWLTHAGRWIRAAYDAAIVFLLIAAALLLWHRVAHWEVVVAGIAIGLTIGLCFVSRKRYKALLWRVKRKG